LGEVKMESMGGSLVMYWSNIDPEGATPQLKIRLPSRFLETLTQQIPTPQIGTGK
jgi:hypothetical protein